MSKLTTEKFLDAISEMTVLEVSELVKAMEAKFGVSAAAPVAVAAASSGAAEESSAEEQTNFDVILSAVGEKKVAVIKVVRTITGLGLKEAKDLVEAAPKAVKEGVAKEEAEALLSQLKEAGATVELK